MVLGMPALIEHETLEQTVSLCRELGLGFIELNMNLPQYQLGALRGINLRKYGDLCFTLHMDENMNPFEFNPEVAAAWRNTALGAVRLALDKGIPAVNMHMPMGVYFTLPGGREYLFDRYWGAVLGNIERFRDEMTAAGGEVAICIENTEFGGFRHLPDALNALLVSPAFCLTYDCGHDFCDGLRALPFYRKHMAKLRHFHLHDAKGKSAHLPLGEGEIDIGGMLDMARSCRVVLETKDGPGLRKSVGYLRNTLQDI